MNIKLLSITRKGFLSVFAFFTSISAYSQINYAYIEEEIKDWYTIIEESIVIEKKTKSIVFPSKHYSITGSFSKGLLTEGTIAKFYNTSTIVPSLLLEGKVSYQAGRLVITGIKYDPDSKNKIYGQFYVSNMDDYSMNYKEKKTGELKIKCSKAIYLEGNYMKCPVIVKLDSTPSIYVDGKTGRKSYTSFSAVIPGITLNNDDSLDLKQILLSAKDNVEIIEYDGSKFTGSVKTILKEDNEIVFLCLDGQKEGMTSGPKSISVKHEKRSIRYTQENNDDILGVKKETVFVNNDGTVKDIDCWNADLMYKHCYFAIWEYRNGDYFEGTVTSKTGHPALDKGVYKYSNGDKFIGNFSSEQVGPFYTDGTTYFSSGDIKKGNWLARYKLDRSQLEKVFKCQNPTEANKLAQKLMYSKDSKEYDYYGLLQYIDPERGHPGDIYGKNRKKHLFYNVINKFYTYVNGSGDIELRFSVDKNGVRQWEVLYKNNKPVFRNIYSWYPNGEMESIKSYYVDTNKLYLSCNFFSDGKIKSAYQYGKSRNGETVLRKTKEFNPTFGRYTSKLYDLNGNFEREIKWDIGEQFLWKAPEPIHSYDMKISQE